MQEKGLAQVAPKGRTPHAPALLLNALSQSPRDGNAVPRSQVSLHGIQSQNLVEGAQ